jgi:hypothetical protein
VVCSYTIPGYPVSSMTLVPAVITVNPAPSLLVDYFIQTFVQGDNPFTAVREGTALKP